jgi:hypothetical protein
MFRTVALLGYCSGIAQRYSFRSGGFYDTCKKNEPKRAAFGTRGSGSVRALHAYPLQRYLVVIAASILLGPKSSAEAIVNA